MRARRDRARRDAAQGDLAQDNLSIQTSEAIRPARWIDGRALVSVAAFRYRAVTVALPDGDPGAIVPYGEVSVAAESGEYPARPSSLCGWCDFARHCPEGLEAAGGPKRPCSITNDALASPRRSSTS